MASRVLLEVARGPVADTAAFYDLGRSVDWTRAPRSARHAVLRIHRQARRHQQHALRRAETQGRHLRPVARRHRRLVPPSRPRVRTCASMRMRSAARSACSSTWRASRWVVAAIAWRAAKRRCARTSRPGILVRARWPRIAAEGGEFLDPMCGSGTFVIEAAWIATDTAPGLLRDYWGFEGWRGHDAGAVGTTQGGRARRVSRDQLPVIVRGADRNRGAIATASANARRAGVGRDLVFDHCDIAQLRPRMRQRTRRRACCASIRPMACASRDPMKLPMRIVPSAWRCADPSPPGTARDHRRAGAGAAASAARPRACTRCGMAPSNAGCCASRRASASSGAQRAAWSSTHRILRRAPGAQMFANRLRKNLQRLGKQARRENVGCWRLYDADMPEYSLAIDLVYRCGPR